MNKTKISFTNINNITNEEINTLVKTINDAYKVAEGDLWINSAKRVTFDELETLINQNQIIIAINNNEIVGSVKVAKLSKDVAEFGMLALILTIEVLALVLSLSMPQKIGQRIMALG
ncbi:hypothetical protein AB4F11_00590 [Francisella philomiragia]